MIDRLHLRLIAATCLLGAIAACGSNPMSSAGIDCDPMVYVSKEKGDEDIWVSSGGKRSAITGQGVVEVNPAWSPDGGRIAFTSGPGSDLDLYTMAADGSDRRLVWGGDLLQSSVDWSPDGSTLVVDASPVDGNLQVFTVPATGGDPSQLTVGEPNGKPNWTPDDRILFLSLRDGETQEIYVMGADGSDPVDLSNDPSRDVLAEMSPDGRRIAFSSDRSGNFEIWLMDADGSNPIQLTDNPGTDSNPTWSSDGAHILYTSEADPVGIWAMRADGSNPLPIMTAGWTPDCPGG
jgi:Tol biopolymer transport system component